jgi:hypothetical protein
VASYPRWVPEALEPSLVLRRPLETFVEMGAISSMSLLMHLVSLLMGGKNHEKRRAYAGFLSPFCLGLPGESASRPPLCEPRTLGLTELQGCLGILHK